MGLASGAFRSRWSSRARVPPRTRCLLLGFAQLPSFHLPPPSKVGAPSVPPVSQAFPIADARRNGVKPGYLLFATTKLPALAFIKVINRPLLSVVKRNGPALASPLATRDPPVKNQAMLAILRSTAVRPGPARPRLNGTPDGSRQRASPDLQFSPVCATTSPNLGRADAGPPKTSMHKRGRLGTPHPLFAKTNLGNLETWNMGEVCSHPWIASISQRRWLSFTSPTACLLIAVRYCSPGTP
jgi:hypothetical protein